MTQEAILCPFEQNIYYFVQSQVYTKGGLPAAPACDCTAPARYAAAARRAVRCVLSPLARRALVW